MTTLRMSVLGAAALTASTIAGYAGPCLPEIESMQARLDARLTATAGAGPTAPESSGALLHHQPTPGSIAAAEGQLGELSPETRKAVAEAVGRARKADQAGAKAACEQELATVERALAP